MRAISVQCISKEFKMAPRSGNYRTIKDLFIKEWHAARRAERRARRFQALEDVSFDVEPGEVIGLIGRNGAGKSTLLKILSRILRPTAGRVEIHGRVGSLLEVGAGFHPELTGRENIFLNSAILGMKHREIVRKLDEIVAFSGIEKHLDEPAKHFSSGMYMKLAFAVAAHIEPEILLLDEVLAVGDAEFQKKSIDRIEQVGRHGQTVVLVSHNIQTVLRLCRRAVCLDRGRVSMVGDAAEVAAHYLKIGGGNRGVRTYPDGPYAPGDNVVRLRGVRARGRDGQTLENVDIGREFGLEMEFEVLAGGQVLYPSLTLYRGTVPILWITDSGSEWHGRPRPKGRYTETAWVPANLMADGAIRVSAAMHSFRPQTQHFLEPDVVVFQTIETQGGARGSYTGHIDGAVRPLLKWTVSHDAS